MRAGKLQLVLAVLTISLWAQHDPGAISGIITDQPGAAAAGLMDHFNRDILGHSNLETK